MSRIKYRFINIIGLVLISTVLTACGGGGGGGSASEAPPPGGSNPPPGGNTKDINLSWTAPTQRTDGTPVTLSEIGGYKLYVGSSSGNYNPAIDVGNTTAYTLNSMSPGTYYMALAAYDVNQQDGSLSSEFPVTVN